MFILASEKTYKDGELIFMEGKPGDWVYIVLSGSVEISRNVSGKKYILGILKPEEVLGELSFFSGLKRTTTAIAIGDTTLGILDRDFLDQEFNKLPSDFRAIIRKMAIRYEELINKFTEISPAEAKNIPKMLSLTFRDPQAFKRAYIMDLSKGGLFIKTKNPLKNGERFILNLQLPNLSEPIQIESEVEWSRRQSEDPANLPIGMRIKFFEIDKNVDHIFKEYIKNN